MRPARHVASQNPDESFATRLTTPSHFVSCRVGYNQFVRLMGYRIGHGACGAAPEAAADEARLNRLDELDDGQPLWCLLTKHASEDEVDMVSWQTDDGTRALRNDCLFEVIKRMIQVCVGKSAQTNQMRGVPCEAWHLCSCKLAAARVH